MIVYERKRDTTQEKVNKAKSNVERCSFFKDLPAKQTLLKKAGVDLYFKEHFTNQLQIQGLITSFL